MKTKTLPRLAGNLRTGTSYIAIAGLVCVAGLAGCSSNSAEVERLNDENRELKQQIAEVKRGVDKMSPQQSSPDKGAATVATFADVKGAFGEKQITELVKIGVLDPGTSPKFEPDKPITRAEFVSWLVKTNNVIRPDAAVRLAGPADKSTFTDLIADHPLFKYIQGMADAGWSIGYEDKSFKPDKILVRQELIAIKTPFDDPSTPSNDYATGWTDESQISKAFYHPMSVENYNGRPNWKRIFGSTKTCEPRKSVTRAEAAVCVSEIGVGDRMVAAAGPQKATVAK